MTGSPVEPTGRDELAKIGVTLFTIPPPTGDEKLRLEGWREGIEEHGQELWHIYHWIVDCQGGSTHGVYRLGRFLETYNVPDHTNGAFWPEMAS